MNLGLWKFGIVKEITFEWVMTRKEYLFVRRKPVCFKVDAWTRDVKTNDLNRWNRVWEVRIGLVKEVLSQTFEEV